MMISFAPLSICIDLTDEQVSSLVIESPSLLYEFVSDMDRQLNRLFVMVNLRSYLGNKDTELFFQSVLFHKIKLLCIEGCSRVLLSNEKRVLIDEDQCVI